MPQAKRNEVERCTNLVLPGVLRAAYVTGREVLDLWSRRFRSFPFLRVNWHTYVREARQFEGYINPDGTLKPDAGALADVFGYERKQQGEKPIRFERTPETIKEDGFYLACLHHRFEAAEFLLGQGVDINAKSPTATALHRVSQLYHGWTTSTVGRLQQRPR